MRYQIVRALVRKEARRHAANRGGLVLCVLLVVAALMLSLFGPSGLNGGVGKSTSTASGAIVGGVHQCVVQYAENTPLIDFLKASVPTDLAGHVSFEKREGGQVAGLITFAPGTGAIQLRPREGPHGRTDLHISIWHPPGHPGGMAAYEAWFWKAFRAGLQVEAESALRAAGENPAQLPAAPDLATDDVWAVRESLARLAEVTHTLAPQAVPTVEIVRSGLGAKELDLRSTIAMGMVVFALYFFCVYLLPTMTCEERERGVLLAQALSPASATEILAAKLLFYPVLGVLLAAVIASITAPAAVTTGFFWLTLAAVGTGFLGIGMTVATLARTQRSAFLGSMCYLLSVSLILFICQQNDIPLVPYLAIEYHGPRAVHAALTTDVQWHHWLNLTCAAGLGIAWLSAAGYLFRRRGWQ